MTRYLTASHPDYPEIDRLTRLIALATNAHMHPEIDMPEAERLAWIEAMRERLGELLDGGVWADFINGKYQGDA